MNSIAPDIQTIVVLLAVIGERQAVGKSEFVCLLSSASLIISQRYGWIYFSCLLQSEQQAVQEIINMTPAIQYQPFCFKRFSVGLRVACTAHPAWSAGALIGNAAEFHSPLESNPGGHYQLTNNIHLNRSFWNPIDNFTDTLNGNGYSVYGLNLQENNINATSGLFRYQYGGISNLIFVNSQVITCGDAVRQGLVAGGERRQCH